MAEGRSSARDAEEGRHGGRTGAGGGDDESSDGRAVELSLGLRTGGGSAAQEEEAARRRRRSMTIFYDGRVCAVEVTELQARAIISMANQEILTEQQRRDDDRHHHQGSGGGGGGSSGAKAQCGGGSGHQNPTAPAALLRAAHCQASLAARQGLEAAAAAPMINHAATGLSMKRSLQRFLQKRKTRADAVASPYAGGRPARPADETLGGA